MDGMPSLGIVPKVMFCEIALGLIGVWEFQLLIIVSEIDFFKKGSFVVFS